VGGWHQLNTREEGRGEEGEKWDRGRGGREGGREGGGEEEEGREEGRKGGREEGRGREGR